MSLDCQPRVDNEEEDILLTQLLGPFAIDKVCCSPTTHC